VLIAEEQRNSREMILMAAAQEASVAEDNFLVSIKTPVTLVAGVFLIIYVILNIFKKNNSKII
jgi:hypothetical protein